MLPIISTAFGIIVLFAAIAVIWRFSSDRASIPCPTWLGWLVELDNPVFKNNSARRIIQHSFLEPGMTVLDVGCGPGRLSIPVAKQIGPAGEVTAFDIQPGMLQRVQAKAEAENLNNIRCIEGSVGAGKLKKDKFDRVLLVTVLGEVPDRKAAMAEIYNCLKPGGILSVTEVIADPHFQKRGAVTRAAVSAGFVESAFFGNRISFTILFEKPKT